MAKHWNDPKRLRGRKGVEQRERRKRMFPLCAECQKEGVVKATDEIDHIVPLALGGEDTDDNIQGLCNEHHERKTAEEDAATMGRSFHPDWLQPSAIPLTIVCGPPASGKTTYVDTHAHHADTIIDLDAILSRIDPDYEHWKERDIDGPILTRAVRTRNAMLGALSRAKQGKAWFIVSAPTAAERQWWADKLGGEVVLLHPGAEECKRRAIARGTQRAVDGVNKWEASSRTAWAPHRPKVRVGLDGWPEDRAGGSEKV